MDFVLVKITRSESTVLTEAVLPWELPILEAIHGDVNCVVTGTVSVPEWNETPEAEYTRLQAKYKGDTETGQEYVALIYGIGARGLTSLTAEMDKAHSGGKKGIFTGEDEPIRDTDPIYVGDGFGDIDATELVD